MTKNRYSISIVFLAVFIVFSNTQAQFKDIIKKLTDQNQSSESQNTDTIVSALKEALQIGTQNSVDVLSVADGYFGNELVKILLPSQIKKVEPMMRSIGLGNTLDEFVLSMNRAAESAASEAGPIFIDAIKEMTITDAINILNGDDHAATDYFREKTSDKLTEKFRPIISAQMDEVGVTKQYKKLADGVSSNPFINLGNLDLDTYVTNKALDGLFTIVAQEEEKIRTDPAAQVTDLLKDVFGSN